MSGTYNDDTFNNPEWNVLQDLKAAQNVYNNWPTEVIASGSEVGVRILYPHESVLNDYPGGETTTLLCLINRMNRCLMIALAGI